jgi:hypothetical protein
MPSAVSIFIPFVGAYPHPEPDRICPGSRGSSVCGFDSDSTGETIASNMIALHPGIKRDNIIISTWDRFRRRTERRVTNPYCCGPCCSRQDRNSSNYPYFKIANYFFILVMQQMLFSRRRTAN